MRAASLPLPLVALTLLATGCDDDPPPVAAAPAAAAEAPAASPPPAAPSPNARGALEILGADGAIRLRLEPKDGDSGYRLKDGAGTKVGKISVQADRVKLKDTAGALLVKVKKKDDGFKVYDGADTYLFKGKLKGEMGLKLKTADGAEVAKLEGARGRAGGAKIEARPHAEGVEVLKDGQRVALVKGPTAPEPAIFLAVDGLSAMQQAAIMVFLKEVW